MCETYEEQLHKGFCEYMCNNHGEDWIDRYSPETQENMRCEFCAGAEWQSNHTPWINVEDALPKATAEGLAKVKYVDGSEGEIVMRHIRNWIYPYIQTGYVTHWKPTPSRI